MRTLLLFAWFLLATSCLGCRGAIAPIGTTMDWVGKNESYKASHPDVGEAGHDFSSVAP